MNEILNRFLFAGDKFMPETHLRQTGFTCSACGPFTKNKDSIRKFQKTGDSKYIYQIELSKVCFQHDMADRDFKEPEEQLLIKYFAIKYLTLLKI